MLCSQTSEKIRFEAKINLSSLLAFDMNHILWIKNIYPSFKTRSMLPKNLFVLWGFIFGDCYGSCWELFLVVYLWNNKSTKNISYILAEWLIYKSNIIFHAKAQDKLQFIIFGGLCNEFNKYYKFRGVQRQQNAQGNRNEQLTDFNVNSFPFNGVII